MLPTEFEYLFSSVHQAVIGTDGKEIIFANSAAKSAAGFDPTGTKASEIIPCYILESKVQSFVCAADIFNQQAAFSVIKHEGIKFLFIDFLSTQQSALCITRQIISNLRNCIMGLKMSADRCFSTSIEGHFPDEKYISAFYHYYYCLARSLKQIDSADMLERGDMLFSPVPTDLVKLCSELIDTVSLLCLSRGVEIKFLTDKDSLIAVVDPARIEQLLLNLFSNSIQHTSRGNTITLSLSLSESRIILSLNDDGDGISQEVLSNIFSLPDDTCDHSCGSGGNGLGLYISFEIAHLHNGVLLIESRENFGTQVRVMLPVDGAPSPKFSCPDSEYSISGLSNILTELADVLPSDCFGPKYED